MASRPRPQHPGQPSLLDWTPPETTVAFEPALVRGATLAISLSRAVSLALEACPWSRETVAARMTAHLGERVTLPMLNGYAAPSRPDHTIPVTRFLALIHVTGDRRLLELLAAPMDWAVIERRHLPMIQLAAVQERQDELRREADALRRQARSRGAL